MIQKCVMIYVIPLITLFIIGSLRTEAFTASNQRSHGLLTTINTSRTSFKIHTFQKDEYDIIQKAKRYQNESQKKSKKTIFSYIYDENVTTHSETINGRLAMMVFTIGIINEIFTGKSLLEQIGFINRDAQEIFIFFLVAIPCLHFANNFIKRFN